MRVLLAALLSPLGPAPAAAQDRGVAPRVEVAPGVGGATGVTPTGAALPGGGPGGIGPDITSRSILPDATVIGPIVVDPARIGRGGLAAGAAADPKGAGAGALATGGRTQLGPGAPATARPQTQAGPLAQGARRAPAGRSDPSSPANPGGPGGSGGATLIQPLTDTVQAIEGAKLAERAGDGAAVGRTLDAAFTASDPRRRGDAPFEEVAAAHGLGGLSPAKQAERLAELADTTPARYAPTLYRHAAQRASETLAPAESAKVIKQVNSSAGRRAPAALKEVAVEAVRQAHEGGLKGKELARVQDALEFWNSHAYLAGSASLSNLSDLHRAVAQLQEAASSGRPRPGKAPKLSFVKDSSDPASGPRLRAELKGGEQAATAVAAVPAALPESLAVPLESRAALELPGLDPLAGAFDLTPPAATGARAAFARRAPGAAGAAAGLWAAARFWLKSAAGGIWRLLVGLWRDALRFAGLLEPAPTLGPGLRLELPPARLAELERALRSSEPIPLAEESPRSVNGYRVGPAWSRGGSGVRVRLGRVESAAAEPGVRAAEPGVRAAEPGVRAAESRADLVAEVLERRDAVLAALRVPGPLDARRASELREQASLALKAFERLATDAQGRRLASELAGWLESASRALEADPASPKAAEAASRLDRPSLQRLVELAAQEALDRAASFDRSTQANLLVSVESGGRARRFAVLELGRSRDLSSGLRALIAALERGALRAGSAMVRGPRVWLRLGGAGEPAPVAAGFGSLPPRVPAGGRAELFADFSAPERGGLLRARLETRGAGSADEARLYLAARVLFELGFSVRVEEGTLSAVADRDHNPATPEEASDRFSTALAALTLATRLDRHLPSLLEGTATRDEAGARLGEWAAWVLAEGGVGEDPVAAWKERKRGEPEREALRTALNRALRETSLKELPATVPIGRRAIDRLFNRPIEAGLARGELRVDAAGRLARAPGYDAFERAVEEARGRPESAAASADAIASAGLAAWRFETLGFAGGLQAVLAQRRLEAGSWLTLYGLRDPAGGALLFARAERSSAEGSRRLEAAELSAALDAPPSRSTVPVADRTAKLRRAAPAPRAPAVAALSLSPSARPVIARLTYDKAKAAAGGLLFATPYLSLEDSRAAAASRGVLLTSPTGGRVGELERSGVPAFALPEAEWTEAGLSVDALRLAARGGASRIASRDPMLLREGAVVKLLPASGRLELVARDVQKVTLLAGEAVTAWARAGDLASLLAWAERSLDSGGFSSVERLALGQTLLEGVAGSPASLRADREAAPALRRTLAKHLGAEAVSALAP